MNLSDCGYVAVKRCTLDISASGVAEHGQISDLSDDSDLDEDEDDDNGLDDDDFDSDDL